MLGAYSFGKFPLDYVPTVSPVAYIFIPWTNSSGSTIAWTNASSTTIAWTGNIIPPASLAINVTFSADKRVLVIPGGNEVPNFLYFDPKDPSDISYLNFNWGAWLNPGAAVSAILSVSSSPSGLTLGTATLGGNTVVVPISGGTAGTTYTVSCKITSTDGITVQRSGYLPVQTR